MSTETFGPAPSATPAAAAEIILISLSFAGNDTSGGDLVE
jgi:hypothetical protein